MQLSIALPIALLALARPAPAHAPAHAHAPDDVDDVRRAHAASLLMLGQQYSDASLFNDAERVLLEALEWGAPEREIQARIAAVDGRRVENVQDDKRDAYRSFLRSKDYGKQLAKLSDEEAQLRERTLEQLLDGAARRLAAEDERGALGALASALELDPDSKDLARVAGKERLAQLRATRAQEHGLEQLELGEAIDGSQVTLDDLKGKIVLWRSSSL